MTMENIILNYVLADIKEKQLKDQGITVDPNFKTRSMIFSSISPNPMVGYVLLENETKKLLPARRKVAPVFKSVGGHVDDSSGNAYPDVTVTIRGTAGEVITDANGDYTLTVPPKGPYTIYFDDGKTVMRRDYRVTPGQFGVVKFS